jgi:hypothetical protein
MKTTILALSFAAIAAMTGATGASAFGSLPLAHNSAGSALTPVTFFSNGHYYHPKHESIGDAVTDYRTDRHLTETPNPRWHKGYYWNKHSWYSHRGYCYHHPYSWRCQRHSW